VGRALLVAFVAAGHPFVAACYTHQCDASSVPYSKGEMIDPDTFETSPLDSPTQPWVEYRGNATLVVSYPALALQAIGGRPLAWIDTYVGTSKQPNTGGDNWTVASGQLAEIGDAGAGGFSVTNASCENYYARFVVHFSAAPPAEAGAPDAAE
jgi:hypothetical protein